MHASAAMLRTTAASPRSSVPCAAKRQPLCKPVSAARKSVPDFVVAGASVAVLLSHAPAAQAFGLPWGLAPSAPPPAAEPLVASTSAAAAVDPIVIQSVQETKRILADSQVLASDVRQVLASIGPDIPDDERMLLVQIEEAAKVVARISSGVLANEQYRLAQEVISQTAAIGDAPEIELSN